MLATGVVEQPSGRSLPCGNPPEREPDEPLVSAARHERQREPRPGEQPGCPRRRAGMPGFGFGEGPAGRLAARGRGGPVKVRRVSMSNFRGVRSGSVLLDSRSLLVGGNAVGKSTICEALDLALGLERLYRRPVIDEYDFHEARYR